MNQHLKELVRRWRASGRIAFYHPRKQTLSLNGHGALNYTAAAAYMQSAADRGEI